MKYLLLLFCFLFATTNLSAQQAELHLENNSSRFMIVKVIKDNIYPNKDYLYATLNIPPYSRAIEYFPQTGNYFLKSKATKQGKKPIFEKGNPFEVYVGTDGYSVLTITYEIEESYMPNPLEGETISEQEFERDF